MEIKGGLQNEDDEAEVAATGNAELAQNNAAKSTEQPTTAEEPERQGLLVKFVPWFVQAMWLTAGVAAGVYFRSRDWGFLEPIPLIVATAFGMSAWLEWSLAWALLARQAIASRLSGFVVAMIGLTVVYLLLFEFRGNDRELLMAMLRIAVGFSVPLLLMSWRGWRIQRFHGGLQARASSAGGWQFSIGELLLLTSGAAVFLALQLARESKSTGEIVGECTLIACGLVVLPIGLSWRRYVVAAPVCALAVAALIIASLALAGAPLPARPAEWFFVFLICAPAFALAMTAIAIVRWCGYRLTQSK